MKIVNMANAVTASIRPISTVCALIVVTVFATKLASSRYRNYHAKIDVTDQKFNFIFLIEQHTARHERLDTLMGGDFQQYRANVACGRPGCLYTASLGRFLFRCTYLLFNFH